MRFRVRKSGFNIYIDSLELRILGGWLHELEIPIGVNVMFSYMLYIVLQKLDEVSEVLSSNFELEHQRSFARH